MPCILIRFSSLQLCCSMHHRSLSVYESTTHSSPHVYLAGRTRKRSWLRRPRALGLAAICPGSRSLSTHSASRPFQQSCNSLTAAAPSQHEPCGPPATHDILQHHHPAPCTTTLRPLPCLALALTLEQCLLVACSWLHHSMCAMGITRACIACHTTCTL